VSSSSFNEFRRNSGTVYREKQNKSNRRSKYQKSNFPLIPPAYLRSSHCRGDTVTTNRSINMNSRLRYKLKRVGGNKEYYMRSNRRRARRSTKPRGTKRKESQLEGTKRRKVDRKNTQFMANFWTEMEVKLDDLSSVDCGAYSDCVNEEVFETEIDVIKLNMNKVRRKFKVEDLDSLTCPANFVFDPKAKEFITRRSNNRTKKYRTITMKELVQSFKGKQLPRMPI